jgi:hypothetical protein
MSRLHSKIGDDRRETIHLKSRKIIFDDDKKVVIIQNMTSPNRRSASSFSGYWNTGDAIIYPYSSPKGQYYLKSYKGE